MKLLEKLFGKKDTDEDFYLISREARRQAGRRAGVLKGSRAHVGRMPGGRKAPPSLATHLGIPTDTGVVRIWHPDYLQRLEDARADAVPDDGKGLRR